ncbi:FadR/GntR family transcriptional regulator [Phytohabitans houttuyneae]|uniref:GntR family transcriptional regulator n=1 Tax=Phytohabitans houttuyneae TaxID=1076126 RepID=A0A6V8KC83_9ACTN|nr:FCD domain-containing protein [Phytohabitans houttuyneae]GFJ82793.1 GntR family transcriptional regulator [Phytohabitans houttuyneae]
MTVADDELRRSLSDALIGRVVDLIRTEGLGPGDRLPSARVLAERFAVATPTIREALRQLQATGAIDIRHGSGMYVNAALQRVVIANPNPPTLDVEQLAELLDARLLVEPYLAGLAARHRSPATTAALRRSLDAAERHLAGDDTRLHEANMAFHRAVAIASGHRILHEVLDSLLAVHAGEQREILQIFDDRSRDHEEHRAVLAAVEAGSEEQARRLMRRHLEDVADVVARRMSTSE